MISIDAGTREVAYYKVGEKANGTPRIWVQGSNLADVGLTKGVPYIIETDVVNRTVSLTVVSDSRRNEEGVRCVSGRANKKLNTVAPIIELSNMALSEVTQGSTRVRAEFMINKLVFTVHHLETKQQERESRLLKNLANGEITKGVLCCGIGVSAAAGHDALVLNGIKPVLKFIVDRERKYLDVAKQNNHALSVDTVVFEASLEEMETDLLGKVDHLQVSLPCTGMGSSGKAKNGITHAEEHPTDAMAILGLIRTIDSCQPSVITSENVKGAMNSATYILLKGMLEVCGYNVTETILDSDYTHSIENRERYWFVATSKGLPVVDFACLPEFKREFSSFYETLEYVAPESEMWKSTEEKIRKAKLNKENGKNFGFNLITRDVEHIGVCGKSYQKDRASEPHIAGENDTMRLLTTTELAKCQSVPLSLIANIVTGTAYEGLGQGIDYRQGQGVMGAIVASVFVPLMASMTLAA
jgi:DNA (cytosine-5)-methyltransferase 1